MKHIGIFLLALGVSVSSLHAEVTVESIIQAMSERMAGVESLEMRSTLKIVFPESDDADDYTQRVHMLLQRPDRLFVDADVYTFVVDGETATLAFSAFQYALQRPITDGVAGLMSDGEDMFAEVLLPDVKAFLSADPAAVLREVIEDFEIVILPDDEYQGRPVWSVRLDIETPGTSFEDGIRISIDQETGLMIGLRASVNMEVPEFEFMPDMPKGYELVYDVQFVSINEPFEDDLFTFDLADYKVVDSREALMEAFQAGSGGAQPQTIAVGTPAPDFELTLMDESVFRLSEHRGKVVLVDFWATWCPPCVQSLPYLQQLYEELGGESVEFVGVSLDRSTARRQVENMVARFSLGYPIGINEDGGIATAYGAVSIPTLVVVDRDGVVRHVKVGFSEPAMVQVAELVRELAADAE